MKTDTEIKLKIKKRNKALKKLEKLQTFPLFKLVIIVQLEAEIKSLKWALKKTINNNLTNQHHEPNPKLHLH